MPLLRPNHISVTNVRPAYQASLAAGVSEADLQALGLPRSAMDDDDASVPSEATYAHFEFMRRRGSLGRFLVDAAQRHTIRSLGVVGLACKTVPNLAAAFACHSRFQHLTNRTARYESEVEDGLLRVTEFRKAPEARGSLVLSDYTLLVAVRLLRLMADGPVAVVAVHSRRPELDPAERATLEAFFEAPIELGAERAALVLPASVLHMAVGSADPELAGYFQQVLSRAARFGDGESDLVSSVRVAIQDALATGTPTGAEIGKRLGMSQRTLQRRLQTEAQRLNDLIADTRMRLAEGYLSDPGLSISEAAYLLGYREETSFFRSFKRWKGVTPTEWRAANPG